MFKRKREPEGRAPSDLPPRYKWARDELVDLRLKHHALKVENMKLRLELVKARGGGPAEQWAAIFRKQRDLTQATTRHGRLHHGER